MLSMRFDGSTLAALHGYPSTDGAHADREGSSVPAESRGVGALEPPAHSLSFARIYRDHFDMVWRVLWRLGVPEAHIEDALQEVFITAHERRATFQGRSSLRTWMYGIARRVARNHRSETRTEPVDPRLLDELAGSLDGDIIGMLEQRDAARILNALLTQLPPERSDVLVLVELEQMTVAEAAEVLDEKPNTIQSRLRLAREDLLRAWNRLIAEQAWRRQCATKTRR
jgi:RNA polymerase sigma-70 factor, ECF subfamily